MKINNVVVLFACILLVTSCKEEDTSIEISNEMTILTSKEWFVTRDYDSRAHFDFVGSIPNNSIVYSFDLNGTYTVNNKFLNRISVNNWTLKGQILTLAGNEWVIRELNSRSLRINLNGYRDREFQ